MTARGFVAGVGLVILAGASGQVVGQAQEPNPAVGAPTRALLDEYCVACHNDRSRQAGLTLESVDLTQIGRLQSEVAVWEKSPTSSARGRCLRPAGLGQTRQSTVRSRGRSKPRSMSPPLRHQTLVNRRCTA